MTMQQHHYWWNDYVGIPYVERGRDRAGVDCWGLVRMVHREVFGRELPSLAGEYADGADDGIADIVAREREGWARTDEATPGDVVAFRILGHRWHVGVCTAPGHFMHAREGHAVCIERLDAGAWRHRVEGIYRYAPRSVVLSACPHPLRTERIDAAVPPGMTLSEVAAWMRQAHGPATLPHDALLMLDGKPIPAELWDTTRTAPGARIEYRAVPRGNGLRAVLSIAIAVVAWQVAPALMGYGYGAAGWTAAGAAGSTLSVAMTSMALNIAGTMLVNAIAPVRLPTASNPGTADAQRLMQGAANRSAPYSAIPVVLGRYRYAAPVGAQTYVESDASTSYLRILLVWGYGPLQVVDLRIGDTDVATLEDSEFATVYGWSSGTTAEFDRIYGQDVAQWSANIKLTSDGTEAGSPWVEHVLDEQCDSITVSFHFPEGLRAVVMEGQRAGDDTTASFVGEVQVRRIDPNTLVPLTGWLNAVSHIPATVLELSSAYHVYNDGPDSAAGTMPAYQWTRLSVTPDGRIVRRAGSIYMDPDGNALSRPVWSGAYDDVTAVLLPAIGTGEFMLWDVCVYGDGIYSVVDRRPGNVTGCDLTHAAPSVFVGAGTVTRASGEVIELGAEGQAFYRRKDAFTHNVSVSVERGRYEVRVRRRNNSDEDAHSPAYDAKVRQFHAAYLSTITGYRNARPITPPPGVAFAMTAGRVKATDQISGTIDGISATVQTICLDYDYTTGTWVMRATRNPASLLRYVWQHPGNAKRVPDSGIDLPGLADFHDWCRVNSWTFDAVITEQRSLDDVARDIAAAGRASPTRRDGKRGVIIDRPRSVVAQHFTPHNSWGFEGVRTLPRSPHAFRVEFANADRGYETDEIIVYNEGYSAANATLFERLELPGVTTGAAVYKLGRFHLAQLRLRPETYTLNADIEHMVCTRGDLVRVSHDVPMWGLGSARIRRRVSDTVIELDEDLPMTAGAAYTLRIRTATGGSVTRGVVPVAEGGVYSTIALASAVAAAEAQPGDLVMFGELNRESVELIVLGIEPAGNLNARITLTDYAAPAIYTADTAAIPPFQSQITLPPRLLISAIKQAPVITRIVSDESVMLLLAPGRYGYQVKASFANPAGLPMAVTHVEGQIDYAGDTSLQWSGGRLVPLAAGVIAFGDVREGESYRMRLRYVDSAGRTGPWTETQVHTVVGKTTAPSAPQGVTITPEGQLLRVRWAGCPEVDVVAYELREMDAGWGTGGHAFQGSADACTVAPGPAGVPRTWYLRGIDAVGLYSSAATPVTYTVALPADTASIVESFADTSLTAATVTLDWPDVDPPFGLQHYRVSYGSVVKTVLASTITLPADWIGNRTFTVQTVDGLGNVSPGRAKTVTKLRPGPVTGLRAQVVDNQVELSWVLPARTTLPVSHVLIRRGAAWETAGDVGAKSGSFTQIQELVGGTYVYWVAAVDTDGWESAAPVSIAVTVSSPPDLVVHGNVDSTLSGSTASAFVEED